MSRKGRILHNNHVVWNFSSNDAPPSYRDTEYVSRCMCISSKVVLYCASGDKKVADVEFSTHSIIRRGIHFRRSSFRICRRFYVYLLLFGGPRRRLKCRKYYDDEYYVALERRTTRTMFGSYNMLTSLACIQLSFTSTSLYIVHREKLGSDCADVLVNLDCTIRVSSFVRVW